MQIRRPVRNGADGVATVRQPSIGSLHVLPIDKDEPARDLCMSNKPNLVRVAASQGKVCFACEALNAGRPLVSLGKVKEIVYVEPESHIASFALPASPTQLQVAKNAYPFGYWRMVYAA